ncbi:TetR/AcrR family transcriptional regulator C-terminal domain-containing protein [Microbacterium resistens]
MSSESDAVLSDPPELPRGIALAWGIASNPQRGPKREMSVERIVETAVALADRDGLGAVSMAAVAKELGFTPMSLYRYVTAKDDLLLLMQEEATGLPPSDHADADGWRAKIEALHRAQVGVYLRHTWLLSLPIHGSPVTPNNAAWMDAYLTALADTPLTADERHATMLAILGHARWYGIVTAGYTEAARDQGITVEEVDAREAAIFSAVVDAEAYPALRAALDAGVMQSTADPFAFGLECQLDGIEEAMRRRREASASGGEVARSGLPALDSAAVPPELLADKRYKAAEKTVREAEKALRDAEKALRAARKAQGQARREAEERLGRARAT